MNHLVQMFDSMQKTTVQEKQLLPVPSKDHSPPPSYSADPPDITAAFSNLSLGRETAKPTRDQCIAHLKLLECFHQLRETVATNDGLFGIRDDFAEQGLAPGDKADLLVKIREKRWAIYVAKAAKRFEAWWQHGVEVFGRMPLLQDLGRTSAAMESAMPFDDMKHHLPPIGE